MHLEWKACTARLFKAWFVYQSLTVRTPRPGFVRLHWVIEPEVTNDTNICRVGNQVVFNQISGCGLLCSRSKWFIWFGDSRFIFWASRTSSLPSFSAWSSALFSPGLMYGWPTLLMLGLPGPLGQGLKIRGLTPSFNTTACFRWWISVTRTSNISSAIVSSG